LIAIGKPGAAIEIHGYLPNDLFSGGSVTDDTFKEEYPAWTTFVEAWKSFNATEEAAENEMEMAAVGGERRSRWLRKYSDSLEECWTKTMEVLTTDWPIEFDGKVVFLCTPIG
jgi:hypothetical protein